jgi:hypothetical protein
MKTNLKRRIKWIRLKLHRFFSSDQKPRLPKKLSESEQTAKDIFTLLLVRPETKLYYDLKTAECYVRSEDSSVYIFLESRNLKIINSVYGYDVNISQELEAYLTHKFEKELYKRRISFKEEALSKIEHSLESTLNKLRNHES